MQILPGTQLDRYVIQGILGEGAMAVVYQAQHAELGSLHAIKQLKLPSRSIRERLIQEGRLQSSFRHPNVLSVTDLLSVDGAPALVMEFVAGPTLADLMDQQQLSLNQIDALARDILRGVGAAHSHGLIHRDLKPANILIAVTEDALLPKVADFGLAKIMESEDEQRPVTRTGATMGTPAYMAPEQIRDSSTVDARADVFSLGAILYELLTGTRCFEAGSVMEIWERICAGSFQPIDELRPELPPRMVRAIDGALVVDREHRIESVASLIACWCSDIDGQHVEVPGRQSMNFWPPALRSGAAAMAPTLEPTESQAEMADEGEGDSSTLIFMPNQTLDPLLPGLETSSTLASPPNAAPPGVHAGRPWRGALLGAFLLGAGGLWWSQQTPDTPSASPAPATEMAHPSPPTSPVGSGEETPPATSSLFALADTASPSETAAFASAHDAILSGDFTHAERELKSLLERHPNDPSVHSLFSITHYFRGRLGLSADAARRAAHLSRDGHSASTDLFKLMDRSWRELDNESGILPKWAGFRSAYSESMVDLGYLVSTRLTLKTNRTLEQIRAVRSQRSDSAIWTVMELRILMENGLFEEMLHAAESGLDHFPTTPTIRLGLAKALVLQDRLEEAVPHLQRVLQDDGSLTAAHTVLAQIYLIQGDEEARLAQTLFALSDTTAPHERVLHLQEHGSALASRGRLSEAERFWNAGIDSAQEIGDFSGALACNAAAINAVLWLRPVEDWAPWQARMRAIVSHPAVDPDLKQVYTFFLILLDSLAAIRQDDLVTAEAVLSQIEALDETQDPLASRAWVNREIRRELAIARRDPTELRPLLKQLQYPDEKTEFLRTCVSFYNEARLLEALGDMDAATSLTERILAQDCRPSPELQWLEAILRGVKAEQNLSEGDLEAAQHLVEAFDRDWPQPDADLTAVQTINALKTRL